MTVLRPQLEVILLFSLYKEFFPSFNYTYTKRTSNRDQERVQEYAVHNPLTSCYTSKMAPSLYIPSEQ